MADQLSPEMHDRHVAALAEQQNPLDALRATFEGLQKQLEDQREVVRAANTILRIRGTDAHVSSIGSQAASEMRRLRPAVVDAELAYRQTEVAQLEPRVLPHIEEDEMLAYLDKRIKGHEVHTDDPAFRRIHLQLGRMPTVEDARLAKERILSRREEEQRRIQELLTDASIVNQNAQSEGIAGGRRYFRRTSADLQAIIDQRMASGEPIVHIISSLKQEEADIKRREEDKRKYKEAVNRVSILQQEKIKIQTDQARNQQDTASAEQQVLAQLRQSFSQPETG